MSTDHDIDFAISQVRQDHVLMLFTTKARQALNTHWPISKSIAEIVFVLSCEQCGGH